VPALPVALNSKQLFKHRLATLQSNTRDGYHCSRSLVQGVAAFHKHKSIAGRTRPALIW
jgi:hypothetical protein